MKTTLLRISMLILVCLSAACGPTLGAGDANPAPGPAAWIDAPLNDTSLPVAEYQVISHASDPAGISSFELSVNGQVLRTDSVGGDQAGQTIAHIQQAWLPPAPGVYLLSLRAANAQGSYGPYAFAHVTVGRLPAQTATASPTPTLTPSPTGIISPTPTLTPTISAPTATGLQNTNCHDGPGGSFKNSGTLFTGKSVLIDSINPEKTWIRVRHPNFDKGYCWIYIPLVQISGDLDGLPITNGPTLPPPPSDDGGSAAPSATPVPTDDPLRPPR